MDLYDLKEAVRRGILHGVEWGIVILIIGFLLVWALNDYNVIRQRALNGQRAFEYLSQQQESSRATSSSTQTAPSPEVGESTGR